MSEDQHPQQPQRPDPAAGEEVAGGPPAAHGEASEAATWRPAQPPPTLVERASAAAERTIDLGSRTIVVYDAVDGEGLRRLEGVLRSLATSAETDSLREIYIVDEIGFFIGADGEPGRAVQALPTEAGSGLLLQRAVLDDDDALETLFARLVRRGRLARSATRDEDRGANGSTRIPQQPNEPGGEGLKRYQGRPVIDSGHQITGGVFLRDDREHPAIVVDHTRDHRLRRLYRELVAAITAENRSGVWRTLSGRWRTRQDHDESAEHRVLRYLHATVREHLPPWEAAAHDGRTVDEAVMSAIAERGEPVRPGQKIYLGEYLRIATAAGAGGGDDVHRSLLATHLLERLLDDGHLHGSVSFEHLVIDGTLRAWVRFVAPTGLAWVVDASEQYVGPVHEAPDPIYLRTEDLAALQSEPF